MKWNRLQLGGLLSLAFFASACSEGVGACEGSLQGRDTVVAGGMVVYGGQAIMNRACTIGCHSSTATGRERHGVPAGLDFDLSPVDEEDAAGTKKSGSATIVKLKSTQIEGLRARQKNIVEHSNVIWQQVQDGLMPPAGMFDSVMSNIFASSEKAPCTEGKEYSKIPVAQTREVFRNWLACGAPLVETNGKKIAQSRRESGAAGYQYRTCSNAEDTITLETLFKSTFSDCGGCHNGGSLAYPPEFLSVEGLAKALRGKSRCGGKPFVTPGKPEKSYLLDILKGPNPDCGPDGQERMPAGGAPFLSDRAIEEIAAWITAGAPTTAADVELPDDSDAEPMSEDDGSPDPGDDQSTDPGDDPSPDAGDEQEGAAKDAGTNKDAGRDAGKDAGQDAGKDAGRDAGKDAGR